MGRGEARIAFAIVLAGGTGRRMGEASKPDVVVAGRRMIDHVLGELAAQGVPAIVVGPPDLDVGVSRRVTLVREDPPLGGPAAGIAAGYAAGVNGGHSAGSAAGHATGTSAEVRSAPRLVAILACDAPFAPRVLPRLTAAHSSETSSAAHSGVTTSAAHSGNITSAGAVAITPDGRLQRLLCVVEAGALGAAIDRLDSDGGVRDRSVRALLGGLPLTGVDVPEWVMDADTPDDVATLEGMSPDTPETSR
ncbi:molybdenum cofactor guanylyltransferase [Corynebacterium sp. NPDC060344]|uniref:molybdenum cofactor guanylyltransferase n=1 Tax=Corynebacterium sp. NPDC060344 TaxID=3347101 RepID=UPI00364C0F8E